MKNLNEPRKLCLRCVVELEDAGYELDKVSGGATITCENCGKRAYGHTWKIVRQGLGGAKEAEK